MIKINFPNLPGFSLKKTFFKLVPFLTVAALMVNCQEDPLKFGLDVLPNSDYVNLSYTDTITVKAYTVPQKRDYSFNQLYSPFGSIVDPKFGKTKAEFMTEFGPSSDVNFGSNPKTDSILIQLYYSGFLGDSTKMPEVEVYELEDTISYLNTDPAAIPTGNFKLNTSGAYQINDSTPIIKIRLNNNFGDRLLHANDLDTADLFRTDNRDLFKSYFKGLYFKTNQVETGGAIFNFLIAIFDLSQVQSSKILLYYHNDSTVAGTSQLFVFPIIHYLDEIDKRVNLFTHDYTGTPVANALSDTTRQDTISYVQSLSGTRIFLKFPYLNNLKNALGQVSIVKAELLLPLASDITRKNFPPSKQLTLRAVTADGSESYLPDDPLFLGPSAFDYFGGMYQLADSSKYSFNIGNYIQDYWNGKTENNGLYLFSATDNTITLVNNANTADRVILTSGNNPMHPMKLKITYTINALNKN